METGRLQTVPAELAGAIRPGKWRDNEVALLHRPHAGADVLHDPDELMPHAAPGRCRFNGLRRPKITPADAGTGHSENRIGVLDDARIGNGLDADIARAI